MARTNRVAVLAALAAALVSASAAGAERNPLVPDHPVPVAAAAGPERWGTASDILYTVYAHEFSPFQGTEGPVHLNTTGKTCGAGLCGWLGSFHLPTGAQMVGVELSGCDSDGASAVEFAMMATPRMPGATRFVAPWAGTGAAPGCNRFLTTLSQPFTVDNGTEAYFLIVLAGPGATVHWSQMRVVYRLQVSPAPAAATFPNDVPTTHPMFRFVEALAASGLTGGCAPGSFCPDSPVTRGQLAVFLASALGLHFPN